MTRSRDFSIPLRSYSSRCTGPVEVNGVHALADARLDVPQGALDLLILRTLALGLGGRAVKIDPVIALPYERFGCEDAPPYPDRP